jgi:Tfp pilus assembly protein PilO
MNKLPKEKRNKVILVWLVTVMLAAAWGFAILSYQLDAKRHASDTTEKLKNQLADMQKMLARKDQIQTDRDTEQEKLDALESQMASGDIYSWVVTTMRNFKEGRKIDIPQISQPNRGENTLLPKFPYSQATLTVVGTAYYQDLGMFIADFENQFQFARIINLDVTPNTGQAAGEPEKLTFKMDIVFLVKPNQS